MNPILMYHYVGSRVYEDSPHPCLTAPRDEFVAHLRAIRAMGLRSVIGPEYSASLARPRADRLVWLTFDDGRVDNYDTVFPLLLEHKMRATFFVTVDACLSNRANFTPLAGLREMADAGMEIASHTLTHPRLAKCDPEQATAEIVESKHRLEDALGRSVDSFCYPYGNWNAEIARRVEQAGYALATSTIRDNRNQESDRWALRRAMVQPGRGWLRFRYLFSPLYHWLHERKNRRRWRSERGA